MILSSLTLQNWRSHADTTVNLSRLNIFKGINHVGKSSIEQAISYLFTGQCEGTDARGAGAAKLIREGERRAFIGTYLDGVPAQVSLTGTSRKAEFPEHGLTEEWAEKSRAVLSCLTSTRYFIGMSAADQKALLSSMVLPDDYQFESWVQEHLNAIALKSKDGKRSVTLTGNLNAVIDDVYEAAFAERTITNRTVKAFVIPSGDTSAAKDPAETKTKLEGLRKELTELEAKQMSAGSARKAHEAKVDAAEKELQRTAATLSREEQEMPAITGRLLPTKTLQAKQAIAAKAKQAETLRAKVTSLSEEKVRLKAAKDKVEKMKEGTCQTCGQAITEDTKAVIYGTLVTSYDAACKTLSDAQEALSALGDPATAQREVDAHERAVQDKQRADHRIAEARTASDQAKKAFSALPGPPPMGEDFTEQIDGLKGRIRKGEEVVAAITAANTLVARQQEERRKLKELEERSANLERLVGFFGPKGIKAKLLDQNIGAFQEKMNAVLQAWGYQAELRFEPFTFGIVTASEGQRELKVLSRSEQYRFAIAFQVALASWSGIRFAVIDEADMLDTASRKALLNMLWKSDLEQAIVLMTAEDDAATKMAGIATYKLSLDGDGATKVQAL